MKLIIKDGFFLSFKIIVVVELRTGARCLEVSLGRLRIGEDTLHPLLAIGTAGEAEGNEAALHMPIRIAGEEAVLLLSVAVKVVPRHRGAVEVGLRHLNDTERDKEVEVLHCPQYAFPLVQLFHQQSTKVPLRV